MKIKILILFLVIIFIPLFILKIGVQEIQVLNKTGITEGTSDMDILETSKNSSIKKDKVENSIEENPSIKFGLIENQTIKISNTNREYNLFIPKNYYNAPVVILFHGYNSNKDELLKSTPYKLWLDLAEQDNIILIIPNGLYTSEKEKGWNDCRTDAPANSRANDTLFIDTLIDYIIKTYHANSNRIYTVGTSNGGHMSIRLANEIPEKITAFASINAANSTNSKCTESNMHISALFINGTDDPILPFDGGSMKSNRGNVLSVENTVQEWVARNMVEKTPEIIFIEDIIKNDNSNIIKYKYSNKHNNIEVVFYKIIGGGHTDPSKKIRYRFPLVPKILGNQNEDIEMATEVWKFFVNKSR